MPDFTIPKTESSSTINLNDLVAVFHSGEDNNRIESKKIQSLLRMIPEETVTRAMLNAALETLILEHKFIVGEAFPASATTHQVFLFTESNDDIDAVDTDGETDKTTARKFDLFKYNGTAWQYVDFIGEKKLRIDNVGKIHLDPSEDEGVPLPPNNLGRSGRTINLTRPDGSVSSITLPFGRLNKTENAVTFTPFDSAEQRVILPDNDLTISGREISLTRYDEGTDTITLPTYTLSISGDRVLLTDNSDGNIQEITLPEGVVDTNTTYTLGINDRVVTLTPNEGTAQSITLPVDNDTDTTYTFRVVGNNLEITPSEGEVITVPLPAATSDTTYDLSIDGYEITLTPSEGDAITIRLPDDLNTTYDMSLSGQTLSLIPSTGDAVTVTLPDSDTTYTFSISGNTLSITPSGGTTQTLTLPGGTGTTYTMSLSDRVLTLTPSSGTAQTITLPEDIDTTYTFTKTNQTVSLTASRGADPTQSIDLGQAVPDSRDLDAGKSIQATAAGEYQLADVLATETIDLLWQAGDNLEDTYTGTDNQTLKAGKSFSDYNRILFWISAYLYDHHPRKGICVYVPTDLFQLTGDSTIGTIGSGTTTDLGHIQIFSASYWLGIRWISDTRFRRTGGGMGIRRVYGIRSERT